MDYSVRRSKKAKRLKLTRNREGGIDLVLPSWVPEWMGHKFANSQRAWIQKHSQDQEPLYRLSVKDGISLPFLGDDRAFTLQLTIGEYRASSWVRKGDVVSFLVNEKDWYKVKIANLLEDFYKTQARKYLTALTTEYAADLGQKFGDIRLKNQKTRWGSCSSKRNLNYNWQVVLAPGWVAEYLVVHEVCHLQEMNHSPRFWELVESLCPDYKKAKAWLSKYQPGNLIDFEF